MHIWDIITLFILRLIWTCLGFVIIKFVSKVIKFVFKVKKTFMYYGPIISDEVDFVVEYLLSIDQKTVEEWIVVIIAVYMIISFDITIFMEYSPDFIDVLDENVKEEEEGNLSDLFFVKLLDSVKIVLLEWLKFFFKWFKKSMRKFLMISYFFFFGPLISIFILIFIEIMIFTGDLFKENWKEKLRGW